MNPDVLAKTFGLAEKNRLNIGIFVDSLDKDLRRTCFWVDWLQNMKSHVFDSKSLTIEEISEFSTDNNPGIFYRLLSLHDARNALDRSKSYFDLRTFDMLIVNRDLLNEDPWFNGDLQIAYFKRIFHSYLREWVEDGGILLIDPQCTHWTLKQECYDMLDYLLTKDRTAKRAVKTSTLYMKEDEKRLPQTVPASPRFSDSEYCSGCGGLEVNLDPDNHEIMNPLTWFPAWYRLKWMEPQRISARIGIGYIKAKRGLKPKTIATDALKRELIDVFEAGKGIIVVSTIYLPLVERREFVLNLVNCAFLTAIAKKNPTLKEKEIIRARRRFLATESTDEWERILMLIANVAGAFASQLLK